METLSSSTPSPSHPSGIIVNYFQLDSSSASANPVDAEEYDIALKNYLNKEKDFKPLNGYMEKLLAPSVFSAARYKAVTWIITARPRHNFQHGTVFAAVNYVDRFLSMIHINTWEMWKAELVAIACLSIASKVDEVFIPNLYDLQTEDQEYFYEPSAIKRLELEILKALDYRLLCVTCYTYLDILIHRINSPHHDLKIHAVDFLLQALLDDKLVSCSAIALAISALQCGIEKVTPFEYDDHYSTLEQLVPPEQKVEKESCFLLMRDYIELPYFCPLSPNSALTERCADDDFSLSIEFISHR